MAGNFMSKSYLYLFLVPLTLLLWGTEYTLVGKITEHMAEAWQVAIRMVAAAALMTAFVYIKGN